MADCLINKKDIKYSVLPPLLMGEKPESGDYVISE